jgi:hypothetical protein
MLQMCSTHVICAISPHHLHVLPFLDGCYINLVKITICTTGSILSTALKMTDCTSTDGALLHVVLTT